MFLKKCLRALREVREGDRLGLTEFPDLTSTKVALLLCFFLSGIHKKESK